MDIAFHGEAISPHSPHSPHRIGKYSNVVALSLHKNVADARLERTRAFKRVVKRWRFYRDSLWNIYLSCATLLAGAQRSLMFSSFYWIVETQFSECHVGRSVKGNIG